MGPLINVTLAYPIFCPSGCDMIIPAHGCMLTPGGFTTFNFSLIILRTQAINWKLVFREVQQLLLEFGPAQMSGSFWIPTGCYGHPYVTSENGSEDQKEIANSTRQLLN